MAYRKKITQQQYKDALLTARTLYMQKNNIKDEDVDIDDLKKMPTNREFLKEEKLNNMSDEEREKIEEKEFNKKLKKVKRLNNLIDYYNDEYGFDIPHYGFPLPTFKRGSHYFYNQNNECVRISNHQPNDGRKELAETTYYIYINQL